MCSVGEKGQMGLPGSNRCCCPECGRGDKFEFIDFKGVEYYYCYCKCGWSGLETDILTKLKYKQKQRKNKLEKIKKLI